MTKTNKVKSSYSPRMASAKNQLYREAHKRINSSIKRGFHIEAIALLESVMSDRLETALGFVTGEEIPANTLGQLFKKLNSLHPADSALTEALREWNANRGLVIHQMVKLTNEHESTWRQRLTFARNTAIEGLEVLKLLRKYTDGILRSRKRR